MSFKLFMESFISEMSTDKENELLSAINVYKKYDKISDRLFAVEYGSPEYKDSLNATHEIEHSKEFKHATKILEGFSRLCDTVDNWVDGSTDRAPAKELVSQINKYFPDRSAIIKTGKAYKIWSLVDGEYLEPEDVDNIMTGKRKLKLKNQISSHAFNEDAVINIVKKYHIENGVVTSTKVTTDNCFVYIPKLYAELRRYNSLMPKDFRYKLTGHPRIAAEDEVIIMMSPASEIKLEYGIEGYLGYRSNKWVVSINPPSIYRIQY